MTTRLPGYMNAIDVHEALAYAHAERGHYIGTALAGVPTLLKRLAGAFHRHRTPRKGAWA